MHDSHLAAKHTLGHKSLQAKCYVLCFHCGVILALDHNYASGGRPHGEPTAWQRGNALVALPILYAPYEKFGISEQVVKSTLGIWVGQISVRGHCEGLSGVKELAGGGD